MPGANERALEKAKGIPADALILDLEDAVAPDAKAEARERVCAAVQSGEYGDRELTIRVNGLGTEWHEADLAAAAKAGPAGVVVPKVNSVERGARRRTRARSRRRTRAHQDLGDARDAGRPCCTPPRSPPPRSGSTVLVMGTNDLAKELHAEHVPGREPLQFGALASACSAPAPPAR